jgi:DNA mismatch endonuclease (patch repair protein)
MQMTANKVARKSDAPRPSDDATRARMTRQRRRDTRPELRLRSELHKLGLRYRLEVKLVPSIQRTADIVFPRARVAVFVDGCFWHSCPIHGSLPKANREWWRAKLEANVSRDRDTDERVTEDGWIVVRAWEHDDPVLTARRVEQLVRSRS